MFTGAVCASKAVRQFHYKHWICQNNNNFYCKSSMIGAPAQRKMYWYLPDPCLSSLPVSSSHFQASDVVSRMKQCCKRFLCEEENIFSSGNKDAEINKYCFNFFIF
jgi:hypothetical protein